MTDWTAVQKKICDLGRISNSYNCGFLSESCPVNLCFEAEDGLRFYVTDDRDGWSIDYSRDPSVKLRTKMSTIRDIKNQTEVIKVAKCLLNKTKFKITKDGTVEEE